MCLFILYLINRTYQYSLQNSFISFTKSHHLVQKQLYQFSFFLPNGAQIQIIEFIFIPLSQRKQSVTPGVPTSNVLSRDTITNLVEMTPQAPTLQLFILVLVSGSSGGFLSVEKSNKTDGCRLRLNKLGSSC